MTAYVEESEGGVKLTEMKHTNMYPAIHIHERLASGESHYFEVRIDVGESAKPKQKMSLRVGVCLQHPENYLGATSKEWSFWCDDGDVYYGDCDYDDEIDGDVDDDNADADDVNYDSGDDDDDDDDC